MGQRDRETGRGKRKCEEKATRDSKLEKKRRERGRERQRKGKTETDREVKDS